MIAPAPVFLSFAREDPRFKQILRDMGLVGEDDFECR
jgi:hypothetical protein